MKCIMEVVVQSKGMFEFGFGFAVISRKEYIGIEHNKKKVKFDFGNSKLYIVCYKQTSKYHRILTQT